jgi:hypothetical protein
MAVSTGAVFFLSPPIGQSEELSSHLSDPLMGDIPAIITGNGTPDADRGAFLSVPKGSVYLQMDASDDAECMFLKVDDSGNADNSDWDGIPLADTTQ